MNVFTSVTLSSLTETIFITMLFTFCCQMGTKCKQLCFPIIPKFTELYNELSETELTFALF